MRLTEERTLPPTATEDGRILGTYGGKHPGPLIFVVGGIHGNEPAGVKAARQVLEVLRREECEMKGRVVALAGNMRALRDGCRYVNEDLNRIWVHDQLERLRSRSSSDLDAEEREQRELLSVIEPEIAKGNWDRVILLDLHSTSADGAPFSIMADTLQNRPIAFALPIPVILGLEERVEGTLLSYFSDRGYISVCVEGGQNDSPSTIEHHVAAIWVTLVAAKALDAAEAPWVDEERRRLEETAWGLPQVVEVRYRFPVPRGARFAMVPGFSNFDIIKEGDGLAHVGPGLGEEVQSPADGLLLMPRYQGQGEDGFFLGNEVRRVWLRVSAVLRKLRLHWILPLLPGVRRDRDRDGVLRANPKVARWAVVELFHLFGFRWSRNEEKDLIFVRRRDRP